MLLLNTLHKSTYSAFNVYASRDAPRSNARHSGWCYRTLGFSAKIFGKELFSLQRTEFHRINGTLSDFQEVTTRLFGRLDAATTTFASVNDLANAMRRASKAHGEHEARTGGQRDENWPDCTPRIWCRAGRHGAATMGDYKRSTIGPLLGGSVGLQWLLINAITVSLLSAQTDWPISRKH